MICNYGKRTLEVFEDNVNQHDQKRRKIEEMSFFLSEFRILCDISISDLNETSSNIELPATQIDGNCITDDCIPVRLSESSPEEMKIQSEVDPMDVIEASAVSVTTIDSNCIVDECIPVRLSESSPEEMKTQSEVDPMDVNDVNLPVEISTGIESVDTQSDPVFQPPLTISLGQLLWARYGKYCYWPAIVYRLDSETSKKVNVKFFAWKGTGSVSKDHIFEFRGIESYLLHKKAMSSQINKTQWKRWFKTTGAVWTKAVIGGTFLLGTKDADMRLPLFDIIVMCSLRDNIKNVAHSLPALISKHSSDGQYNAIQKMFAENPNIFEDVKQKLAELSSEVVIPAQETATRRRLPTPSAATLTIRKPSNMSPMRRSTRIAAKQNQSQLSDSRPSAIDETLLATDMEKREKQQKRKTENKSPIQLRKDLELYMEISRQKGALFKGLPDGNVCKKCLSVNGDLVKCAGSCFNHVHRSCAHSTNLSTEVKCDECLGVSSPICYACRQTSSESMVRCSYKLCGHYYHNKCLSDNWPQTKDQGSGKVICPLHVCHTCVSDDPVNKNILTPSAESTRCIRCPTAFHTDSNCIPAGVRILTKHQHICIRHRSNGKRKLVSLKHCYICGYEKRGGEFAYCDSCPLTAHKSCLKINPPAREPHLCDGCENGAHPMYGDVVWAKFARFRWWPSIVVPPDCIPSNLNKCVRTEHDICVRFFDTLDFGWIGRSFVYKYEEKFGFAMVDEAAKQAHDWYKIVTKNPKMSLRPAEPLPYKTIKHLFAVHPAKQPKRESNDWATCNCSAYHPDPCGPTSDCENRRFDTECDAESCPAGSACKNQDIEKRNYAPIERQHFGNKGFGLVAKDFICEGALIIEYVGELVTAKEFKLRRKLKRTHNFYFMQYDNGLYIDAENKGNLARFMNHSCNPNCKVRRITVRGVIRCAFFAIRNIEKGVELTFDYNYDAKDNNICYCGETNCSGVIGRKVGGTPTTC